MNKPTLVIPDLHIPFNHRNSLSFCKQVYKDFGCKDVVCIGDILDHHRISRHVSEPDAWGAMTELEVACKELKKWYKAFPKVDIVDGNHDLIPYRQAKELGIPRAFLRDLEDVYGMPKGWKFHPHLVKDGVYYIHIGGSGMNASMNKAKQMSMSTVCGHTHRHGGVIYFSNPKQLFFGLNSGCLLEKEAYAMRYNNTEPTLGCGVVYSSTEAYFIPMKLK